MTCGVGLVDDVLAALEDVVLGVGVGVTAALVFQTKQTKKAETKILTATRCKCIVPAPFRFL